MKKLLIVGALILGLGLTSCEFPKHPGKVEIMGDSGVIRTYMADDIEYHTIFDEDFEIKVDGVWITLPIDKAIVTKE